MHGRKKPLPSSEGFQTTGKTSGAVINGVGSAAPTKGLNNIYSGSRGSDNSLRPKTTAELKGSDGSRNYAWVHFPSQLDNGSTYRYKANKTPYDSYYDRYEENETIAIASMALKIKDFIAPVQQPVPNYGDILGTFDSASPTIPWDYDNKDQNQADVVWGVVSEEASKSLMLKNWIQTVMADIDKMPKCSQESAHFCYESPLLNVSTTDRKMAILYEVADQTVQNLGGALSTALALNASSQMNSFLGQQAGLFNIDDIKESYRGNKAILLRMKNTVSEFLKVPISPAETTTKMIGNELEAAAGGQKKAANVAKSYIQRLKKNLIERSAAAMKTFAAQSAINLAAADAAALAANVTAAAVPTPVTAALAVAATAISTLMHLVFGFLAMVIMAAQSIVSPIVQALFHPGGVCPANTKRLSELISPGLRAVLTGFVPVFGFIDEFDPYICWGPEPPYSFLMTPPKLPAFMQDKTLSLSYHSNWLTGNSANIPQASYSTYQLDPLEPGYKWLDNSDLANSNNINSVIEYARNQAVLGIKDGLDAAVKNAVDNYKPRYNSKKVDLNGGSAAAGSAAAAEYKAKYIMTGGSGTEVPNYIAVSDCPPNTVATQDGMKCIGASEKRTTKIPRLDSCPANSYDDGFNCWKTQQAAIGCTGGQAVLTTGTWDDTMGYSRVSITPLICDGKTLTTNSGIIKYGRERAICDDGYEKDTVNFLCYAECSPGFTGDGAICKSSSSVNRTYKFATHAFYREQKLDPEIITSLSQVTIAYCDFSDPVMLNKMAQFYYDKSMMNPQINENGTITVQRITGFLGVAASSELSCDVACTIRFITYDPITGGMYSELEGCAAAYKDDEMFRDCPFCYRRFYFIRGDSDPRGQFSVTGCTFADYTAPSAMVLSYDPDENLLQSLPKTFDVVDKQASIRDVENLKNEWNSGRIAAQAGQGLMDIGIMMIASKVGELAGGRYAMVGGVVGGLGAGMFTSMYLDKIVTEAAKSSISTAEVTNAVTTVITGSGNNLSVAANNNWWTINKGPIYELAQGITPNIEFCRKSMISTAHCANKYVVRDFVDKYHLQYKSTHIRYIKEIEPRGEKGCYYKFVKVSFDAQANLEGTIEEEDEVILDHEIRDYATCTYSALSITENVTNNLTYPVRHYIDPATAGSIPSKIIYPTRDTVYTSDLVARFVRIRPPVSLGDGVLNLVQLAVFDVSGRNISSQQPTYATSLTEGAGNADSVVNGTAASSSFLLGVWQQSLPIDREKDYWEVDLGANMNIAEVVYMGGELETGVANYDTTVGTPVELTIPTGTAVAVNTVTIPAGKGVAMNTAQRTAQGRYVRVMGRSSTTTTGALGLTQIIVTDANGYNVALGKPTFASSWNNSPSMTPAVKSVVDGRLTPQGYPNCFYVITDFSKNKTPDTEFVEVDLGDVYNIASVTLIQDPNHTSLSAEDRISGTRIKISKMTSSDALKSYTGAGSRIGSNYMSSGRNIGVRIEFLYTNGPTDKPIYTLTLPTDNTVQYIPVYSSLYTTPSHPVAGPIKIPRPIMRGVMLAPSNGCINKCEDRGVIDSLVTQYNDKYYDYSIIAGESVKQEGSYEYILPDGSWVKTINIPPNTSGRYIAILPSLKSGDGWINLRQVNVYDSNGINISLKKLVRTTSVCNRCADGSAIFQPGSIVVDGNTSIMTTSTTQGTIKTFTNVWQPATGNKTAEALEIDLGTSSVISYMQIIGRSDCCNSTFGNDRMNGLRIQINNVSKFKTTSNQIVKVLRGITATGNKCEYEAEVLINDSSDSMGSDTMPPQVVARQYLSMDVTPSNTVPGPIVSGRYVRFIPSFTAGSVLEVYNVIVRNTSGINIAKGRYYNSFNKLTILDEGSNRPLDDSTTGAYGPSIFRARDNDPSTYFEIDLGDTSNGAGTSNQPIYSVIFVGQADRTPGGIQGVELQIYADKGTDPIYRFILGTQTIAATATTPARLAGDDSLQTIIVSPPAKCQFTVGDTTILQKPIYLMDSSGGIFTATDTSGGVFTVSSIIGNLQSAWGSALSGVKNSEDLTAPLTENVKESGKITKSILETVGSAKTLGSTSITCRDPAVMNKMILSYNISRGLSEKDYNGLVLKMTRILKSGQSTANTCDVLFEETYEVYDQYLTDIKDPKKKGTQISAVRFKMSPTGIPGVDDPDADRPNNIMDISSNALGILTNVSMVSPPFSWNVTPSGTYPLNGTGKNPGVDCMSPTILSRFRTIIESVTRPYKDSTVRTTLKTISGVFQSTPLTCEYAITREDIYTNNNTNRSFPLASESTVKAIFTLGSDGLTAVLGSIKEYYSGDITISADKKHQYIDGKEVFPPNIYYYDMKKDFSTRVDRTGYTF